MGDLSFVPQAFYDLIGRIIPGAALLLTILVLSNGIKDGVEAAIWSQSTVAVLLINVLVSYVVGALLGSVGFFGALLSGSRKWTRKKVIRFRWLRFSLDIRAERLAAAVKVLPNRLSVDSPAVFITKSIEAIQHVESVTAKERESAKKAPEKRTDSSAKSKTSEIVAESNIRGSKASLTSAGEGGQAYDKDVTIKLDNCDAALPFVYDLIHCCFPKAGARMAKLRAEEMLGRSLAIGWSAIAIGYAALSWGSWADPGFVIREITLIAAAVLAYGLYKQLQTRLGNHMINYLFLASRHMKEPDETGK